MNVTVTIMSDNVDVSIFSSNTHRLVRAQFFDVKENMAGYIAACSDYVHTCMSSFLFLLFWFIYFFFKKKGVLDECYGHYNV